MNRLLCIAILFVAAPAAAQDVKSYGWTGKDLPSIVSQALKVIPEAHRPTPNDVVVVHDMKKFAEARGITDKQSVGRLMEYQRPFVLNYSYPIIINADPRAKNKEFTVAEEAFRNGRGQEIMYAWAAMLAHEVVHAQSVAMRDGQQRSRSEYETEWPAYEIELAYLKFWREKKLVGDWADTYIAQTKNQLQTLKDRAAQVVIASRQQQQ